MAARGLASVRGVWHCWRVRSLRPLLLLLMLSGMGCTTAEKRAARAEAKALRENSRVVEQRRHLAVQRGDAGSARGAEIMVIDPTKAYDPGRSAVGGRPFNAGAARTKEFYYNERTTPRTYRAKEYAGAKPATAAEKRFSTRDASTRGRYEIPNVDKVADTKTAPTKEAWDARKTAEVKNLRDGRREYLGPESKKARQTIDPAAQATGRLGGESVLHTGGSTEKFSTLKPLTIEDIRDLLNKNE